jgi:hypothetical protein
MKLANAIEGGLAGATTLTLLQEALHKIDNKSPRPLLHKSGIIKRIRKTGNKKGATANKLYIQLAGELLATSAYFGLSSLGKNKNAVLRGGLLGAAAGLGSIFLRDPEDEDPTAADNKNDFKDKALTVALYTAGGLLAGLAVKKMKKGSKSKRKK